MKTIAFLVSLVALALVTAVSAEPRSDHFKGKLAPTLAIALTNLAEANAELATILKKETLDGADLLQVHMLSYTIEKALEKLGQEQARAAALMEEVHLASEKNDAATVRASGAAYLKAVAPIVPAGAAR